MREKYPQAEIMTLIPKKVLSKGERFIDELVTFFTDACGVADILHSLKLVGCEYYLVICEDKQYLVIVSDEFIEAHRMNKPVNAERGSQFQIGDIRYTNCGPIVYA